MYAPGHVVALHVTPVDIDDRVGALTCAAQAERDESVEKAFVDRGYASEKPAKAARTNGRWGRGALTSAFPPSPALLS